MAHKSTIIEVKVPFRVTVDQEGELVTVQAMQDIKKYYEEAVRDAVDAGYWEADSK